MQAPSDDKEKLSQIADVCRWYAADGPPTAQREAAALAELAHLTGGRTDLLAQFAGQILDQPHPGPDAAARDRAVQLCITAGADMTVIDQRSRENGRPNVRRTQQRV